MKFFEDFRLGERVALGSHTFTADGIKAFAARFDPQPFHLDEDAASRSPFGALCASGWHTAAVFMRHFVEVDRREAEEQSARGERVARDGPSPGLRDLRWHKPVYAGDTISYMREVMELRVMPDRPGWGLMVSYNTGTNQNGVLVFSFRSATFVERRGS